MSFKNWLKKVTGVADIEQAAQEAAELRIAEEKKLAELREERLLAEESAKEAQEAARLAKISPKELATEKEEPWVAVLETHVNIENPRNGFFELDWNDYFVAYLRDNGYSGGSDEEVVDGWFQDLCREIGNEEGVMMDRRYSGYINVNNLGDGRSEVS